MITGTTSTGFNYAVDPDAVLDMEFLDLVGEAESNPAKLGKMFECLLGKTQKKALYDHVRTEAGRVLIDDVKKEVDEIFDAINSDKETKN